MPKRSAVLALLAVAAGSAGLSVPASPAARAAPQKDPLKPARSSNNYLLAAKLILHRPRVDDGMTVLARYLGKRPDSWEGLYLRAAGLARQGKAEEAVAALARAFEAGLPAARVATSAEEYLGKLAGSPEVKELLAARMKPPLHGPMLCRVTGTTAGFWVRTLGERTVQVVVGEGDAAVRSGPVKTAKARDFTAVAEVKGLTPATEYAYDVLVDGKSSFEGARPRFRTYPAAGQKATFRVAFGGGARYVPSRERIWDTVAAARPLAFLFLGDNIYVDAPGRADAHRHHYYRRQARPSFRRMTAGTAVYAIYDDHDFGRNDTKGGNDPDRPKWKRQSLAVFAENWANPAYGGGPKHPGCWFRFAIGDVDFFMLDQRYYWDVKAGTILGAAQKQWLLDGLAASKATFKVLASGTLWTEHADKGGADSWESVRAEREAIFDHIRTNRIDGVILLSADRHRTEIWKLDRPGLYPLYEFESSKLTNVHTHGGNRKKTLWTNSRGNFFGLLTFDTAADDPAVTFQAVDVDGKALHTFKVPLGRISFK